MSDIKLTVEERKKVALLRKARQYAINNWGFNASLLKSFTKLQSASNKEADASYFYLYVCYADKIKSALPDAERYEIFGEKIDPWEEADMKKYRKKGHSILVYKTPSSSGGVITKKLLSHSPVTIIKSQYHEFVHDLQWKEDKGCPYVFEESLAEVVGYIGTIEFIKNNPELKLNIKEAIKLRSETESIAKLINEKLKKVTKQKIKWPSKFYEEGDKELQKLLQGAYPRTQERFNYEFSPAYLLRYRNYYKYYFTFKQILIKKFNYNIAGLKKYVWDLPDDEEDALKVLKEFK